MSTETTGAIVPLDNYESAVLESVVVGGDLSRLSSEQRLAWYQMRCNAAGLDPRTQPFAYLNLQGKLTLYATKTATEQLCERRGISTEILNEKRIDDIYIVTCRASTPTGRFTDSTGAVNLAGKKGDDLCNAYMKAETKSKRRAVLALCGLGMLDETETETIPNAVTMPPEPPPPPRALQNGNGHTPPPAKPRVPNAATKEQRERVAELAELLYGPDWKPQLKKQHAKPMHETTRAECAALITKLEGFQRNREQVPVTGEVMDAEIMQAPARQALPTAAQATREVAADAIERLRQEAEDYDSNGDLDDTFGEPDDE